MKVAGQTDLDQLSDLPPELRQRLRGMWIEGVEEYLALLAAADPQLIQEKLGAAPATVEGSRQRAVSLLGPPRAQAVMQSRSGGALGCKLDPTILRLFEEGGEVRPRRARPPMAIRATLPPAARHMNRLPPVKNQGNRGTCVAFSSIALRECLAGLGNELSEQFLYWACKELDGSDSPGTFIHTAMTALATYGTCRGPTWPYEPQQFNWSESQGPPPAQAIEEALEFRMFDTRTVEPSYIDQYKQVLAGGEESTGMPVVFAVLVFNSWYCSAETHRTGKITMPLPGEKPLSYGHAMCVVGYVDDQSVPGGGYFIVRNSWGAGWAKDSPEAAGHAMMPYAYAENFAVEAYTGPSEARIEARPQKSSDPMARYISRLKEPSRDVEGKLVSSGTAVLASPAAPGEFMEDTPANRQKFADAAFAWTTSARAATLLPDQAKLPAQFTTQLTDALAARQRFFAAIDENLKSSIGETFPDVNLPLRSHLLPWEPRINEVVEEADLTAEIATRLRSASGVPADVADSAQWSQTWRDAAVTKVYCLSGGGGSRAHVVVSVITPISVGPMQEPSLKAPAGRTIEWVHTAYNDWRKRRGAEKPAFTFYTVGSFRSWPKELDGIASGDSWTICSSPADDTAWKVSAPPRFADRLSLRNFLDRLRPETRQQRISKVKAIVDDLLESGYEGNIHIEKLAGQTAFRRSAIEDAMLALQDSGHYKLYRTTDGLLAVGPNTPRSGPRITASSLNPASFSHWISAGLLLAVGIAAVWLREVMMQRHFGLAALMLVPLAYVGRIADRRLNRLLEAREKN